MPKMEKPVLIHCKSGADRTGLAAAIYLLTEGGKTLDQAERQLSLRYIHLKRTSTGILDQVLRSYRATGAAKGLGFRDWVATLYDPDVIRADFQRWRGRA